MAGKTFLYVGAGIFSSSAVSRWLWRSKRHRLDLTNGSSNWLTFGLGFAVVGILFLAGGAGLVYAAYARTEDRSRAAGNHESGPAWRYKNICHEMQKLRRRPQA